MCTDSNEITRIKARLFDLQGHLCDGRLTINPNGRPSAGDHGCSGCSETLQLRNRLAELHHQIAVSAHCVIDEETA